MNFCFDIDRAAGILIPVFAIRHEKDHGIGDTEGVRQMIDWCAQHHLSILQFLPVNETSSDNSPYNALSSYAIDPTTIFLDPKQIPGLNNSMIERHFPQDKLNTLRESSVCYSYVKSAKQQVLRDAFHHASLGKDFQSFQDAHKEWLYPYCLFRFLCDEHNTPVWDEWPLNHQSLQEAEQWIKQNHWERFQEQAKFRTFIQWIAYQQWIQLKQYADAKGVYLVGDIPFGISRYSSDTWSNKSLFNLKWSGGAPPEPFFQPDEFTTKWGQNWGIPLYNWEEHKKTNYHWWQQRVKTLCEYVHFFRIDHVLGFYRIYGFPWSPQQNAEYVSLSLDEVRQKAGDVPQFFPGPDTDPHWAYWNRVNGEENLRQLQLASGECLLIAEDLGMVPDYVRPSLTSLGIPGFKIPLFERNEPDRSYKDSSQYPPLSIATFGTHDHLPVAALWKEWWKQRRQNLNPGAAEWEQKCLLQWVGISTDNIPEEFTNELHLAICRKLMECSSAIAIFMITDWLATSQRFNIPGPASDSNWSERMPVNVSELDSHPDFSERTNRLTELIKASGRSRT